MTTTDHAGVSPEVPERANWHARYYRTIPAGDAIAGLFLRLASVLGPRPGLAVRRDGTNDWPEDLPLPRFAHFLVSVFRG